MKYGGFCAWAVSGELDYPWSADCLGPRGNWRVWTIQNEKLYFFLHVNPKNRFIQQLPTIIDSGDSRWEGWFPGEEYEHMSTQSYLVE